MKKKIILILFSVFLIFCFAGCENTNDLRCVYFNEITSPGSQSYTLRVTLEKDSRVDEKDFDIQVRSSEIGEVDVFKENEEKLTISFEDTRWKSFTNLICKAKDQEGKETFKKYKDISSLTYIFESNQNLKLKFRAVVGESKENSLGTGYILTNSKEISSEFILQFK